MCTRKPLVHILYFRMVRGLYNKVSQIITKKLLSYGVIKKNDFEVYRYGFELLISLLITILVIVIISCFLGKGIESIIYLVGFFSVRVICGGYHAKHHWSCFLTTLGTYFFFLFIYFNLIRIVKLEIILFCLNFFSSIIIMVFAPVEDPNNRMSEFRKRKSKILGLILSLTIFGVFALSCLVERNIVKYFVPYFIGIFISSSAILVARIEKIFLIRKEEHK